MVSPFFHFPNSATPVTPCHPPKWKSEKMFREWRKERVKALSSFPWRQVRSPGILGPVLEMLEMLPQVSLGGLFSQPRHPNNFWPMKCWWWGSWYGLRSSGRGLLNSPAHPNLVHFGSNLKIVCWNGSIHTDSRIRVVKLYWIPGILLEKWSWWTPSGGE